VFAWSRSATKNAFLIGQSSVSDCRTFQAGFMDLLHSVVVPQ
jgi:hypothetical protein